MLNSKCNWKLTTVGNEALDVEQSRERIRSVKT